MSDTFDRDAVALEAMKVLLAGKVAEALPLDADDRSNLALDAYELADAMDEARKPKPDGQPESVPWTKEQADAQARALAELLSERPELRAKMDALTGTTRSG